MLKYNNPIQTKEGCILSVDKVRLVFKFKSERDSGIFRFNLLNNYKTDSELFRIKKFMYGLEYAETDSGNKVKLKETDFYTAKPSYAIEEYVANSNKYGTYKYMYTIHPNVGDKETIVVGQQLNNNKDTVLEGFMEFNPNKVAGEVLSWILKTLRMHCVYLILKRYDLALDVPVAPSQITLHKDERKYELHRPSADTNKDTEYLGARNTVGRFKKYNKTIEHNMRANAEEQIEEDVTRLEITLNSFEYTELCKLFPRLEIIKKDIDLFDHIGYTAELEKLNATDRVLLQLLQESEKKDQYFSMLGRDKKKKLEPFLYKHFKERIIISEKDFITCISKMLQYLQLFNTNVPNKLIR